LPSYQFILPSKPQNMATGLLYLMPSLHFKTYGILTQLLNLQGLVISVHMSFLQLNHIESVTSQLL